MERSGARSITIRYEQAVYGSFPFWDKGYAVLAQSPGCRPEWLAALRAACQQFGERPGGVAEAETSAIFALRLERGHGPWMIVGVGSPGSDDRGRPGALAFHALFLSPRDYRRLGCDPFALTAALRNDWTEATRNLSTGTWTVTPPCPPDAPIPPHASRIAAALVRGHRVAIEASAPIDALARQVWRALPGPVRRRATVATWAFANGNRFDLVALPRLAGVALDASYLNLAALDDTARPSVDTQVRAWSQRWSPGLRIVAATTALAALISGLAWHRNSGLAPASPAPISSLTAKNETESPPPDRAAYRTEQVDLDQSRHAAEALRALAERFGVSPAEAGPRVDDPGALMVLLAERLRYRGPWLSGAERASLAAAPRNDREAILARRWDALMHRFGADRPLPGDFARGPLGWQLATLAWSFHLDPDDPSNGRRSAAEVVHALGEALGNDLSLAPIHLCEQHPALAAYRDFLGRLPRR